MGAAVCASPSVPATRIGEEETHVSGLSGEEDNLVELREVGEEIVDTGTLCRPPSVVNLHAASAPV